MVPPNPPWASVPGAQPQPGPPSTSRETSLGWGGGCLPVGTGVAQGGAGWMCRGRGVPALPSRAHTLFWEELDACWAAKYPQRAL